MFSGKQQGRQLPYKAAPFSVFFHSYKDTLSQSKNIYSAFLRETNTR